MARVRWRFVAVQRGDRRCVCGDRVVVVWLKNRAGTRGYVSVCPGCDSPDMPVLSRLSAEG